MSGCERHHDRNAGFIQHRTSLVTISSGQRPVSYQPGARLTAVKQRRVDAPGDRRIHSFPGQRPGSYATKSGELNALCTDSVAQQHPNSFNRNSTLTRCRVMMRVLLWTKRNLPLSLLQHPRGQDRRNRATLRNSGGGLWSLFPSASSWRWHCFSHSDI